MATARYTEYVVKRMTFTGLVYLHLVVLTHQERFAVASSVNGKTPKNSMTLSVVSPCFSMKVYRLHLRRYSKTHLMCLSV